MKIAIFETEPREAAAFDVFARVATTTVDNIVTFLEGTPANVVAVRSGETA